MNGSDETHLRQCIRLAEQNAALGDEPFAALLASGEQVLATATNRVLRDRDRTRHAELLLVSEALRRFDPDTLAGSTVYASTEPCPMCAAAIYWGRIPRLVFGCSQEALARYAGGTLSIPCREIFARGRRHVETVGPFLEPEALRVHETHWSRTPP